MTKLFVVISLVFSLISATKISSKINLDHDEQCTDSASVDSDPVIIVIKNEPDLHEKKHDSKLSGSRSISRGNFVPRFPGNSIKARNNYNPPSSRSKIIKNIYIVVNGGDVSTSGTDIFQCKNNVCETTITGNNNDEDNEIGSLSVKVHAKPKSFEIDDVPVVDGVRASGYDRDNVSPEFNNVHRRFFPHYHVIDNAIPQKHVPKRTLLRSHSIFSYSRRFGPRDGSTAWNPWIPDKRIVDDKIELPFSKTDVGTE